MNAPVKRIDQFAELLSRGLSMSVIAERLGVSQPYCRAMLQRIIKRLGKEQCR